MKLHLTHLSGDRWCVALAFCLILLAGVLMARGQAPSSSARRDAGPQRVGEGTLAPNPAHPTPRKPWQHFEFRSVLNGFLPIAGNRDINGDGLSDVVIGGYLENGGKGRVVAFYGKAGGLGDKPDWSIEGETAETQLGMFVALVDVNGDGFDDLVEASPVPPVRVFFGSTNGLAQTASQTLPARAGPWPVCSLVAAAGDVNGDGFGDVAIHSRVEDTGAGEPPVAVLLFHGSREGLQMAPSQVIRGEQVYLGFGGAFGGAGDINRDGYDDLYIGCTKCNGRYQNGGKAWLHLGSPEGVKAEPAWTMEYPLPIQWGVDDEKNQFFGHSIGPAGDVNADGYDDLLVGASFASHGEINEGVAFLFLGSSQGLSTRPDWHADGNHPHVLFASSVQGAGDVNRDGFDDVVVGAPWAEHGQRDEGVAVVYLGCKQGLQKRPAWTFDGDRTYGHMGLKVLGAGDLNGDGAPDLLLAGIDCEQASDVRLRVVAVYGGPGGLRNSSEWRVNKPLLVLAQERLDRISTETLWISTTALACAAVLGLLFVQARLRRRLATLVERNRELILAEERTRLARDVHDHLGADLTLLAMQLEQARQESASEKVTQRLVGLSRFASRLMETVRELVWATKPECDTLESLASYLSELSASYLETHGIRCELDFPVEYPPRPIKAAVRHNLLLMVKETLHNVVQHARADHVEVWLQTKGPLLIVGIRDNGVGFDVRTGQPSAQRGSGLQNLRDRAAHLGGECRVHSVSGQGTVVEFFLPFDGGECSQRRRE